MNKIPQIHIRQSFTVRMVNCMRNPINPTLYSPRNLQDSPFTRFPAPCSICTLWTATSSPHIHPPESHRPHRERRLPHKLEPVFLTQSSCFLLFWLCYLFGGWFWCSTLVMWTQTASSKQLSPIWPAYDPCVLEWLTDPLVLRVASGHQDSTVPGPGALAPLWFPCPTPLKLLTVPYPKVGDTALRRGLSPVGWALS